MSVFFQVVADAEEAARTYRRWAASGRVAGVVVGATTFDPKHLKWLDKVGMPMVLLGDPSVAPGLPHVWTDDAGTMREAVESLKAAGHRVIGHVSGPTSVTHTGIREQAFMSECDAGSILGRTEPGDYSIQSGRQATAALLAMPQCPTAIIFDNDLMALGGLEAAKSAGLDIPQDISLLAWDDSVKCQLSEPPLSAMQHDVQEIGELIGAAVLDAIAGAPPQLREGPRATFHERGSTRSDVRHAPSV